METPESDHLRDAIVRPATAADIPFLAEIQFIASLPPSGRSFWEELVEPTETPTTRFLAAMLATDASNWGDVGDFIVIEVGGRQAAACAVYRAKEDPAHSLPLNLDRISPLADRLGWSAAVTEAFRARYHTLCQPGDLLTMTPQAPLIVESVAVLPAYRGLGLGRRLMDAAFDEARRRKGTMLGVSVLHDNVAARRLYEQYFDPYVTFYSAYFDGAFPSLTKLRTKLSG